MLLFDIEKYVGQKYSPKNKYFLSSFNNCRGFSLDDKTKDYVDRNTGGRVHLLHEVTQLGLKISTVKICIFEWSNENNYFSKSNIHFHKKATPQVLGHIGLQSTKVRVKRNFGRLAKIFQICSMDADILSYTWFTRSWSHSNLFEK